MPKQVTKTNENQVFKNLYCYNKTDGGGLFLKKSNLNKVHM